VIETYHLVPYATLRGTSFWHTYRTLPSDVQLLLCNTDLSIQITTCSAVAEILSKEQHLKKTCIVYRHCPLIDIPLVQFCLLLGARALKKHNCFHPSVYEVCLNNLFRALVHYL